MKWWQSAFTKGSGDLDREVQGHIEMAIQDRLDRGSTYEDARAAVLREFGNVALIKEVDAEMSSQVWMSHLLRDIRYALRRLKNSPGFSLTVVLTLALAIGANSSVFSLVHAILLRSLPFDEPSRVLSVQNVASVGFYDRDPKNPAASFNAVAQSFKTIEQAAQYSNSSVNADFSTGIVERLKTTETSAGFLNVLGVRPMLGRGFLPEEEIPGNDHVVLISDRFWRRDLQADPSILERRIKLNGTDFAVIGVLPSKMDFPAESDLWTPTVFDIHSPTREGGAFMISLIVRARTGMSTNAVRAEFQARALRNHPLAAGESSLSESDDPTLTPIAAELTRSIRSSLITLTIAVSLVLLVACANVAGLCLVRVAERRHEFAVCTALGAGAGRLMRQQLIEHLLVAIAAGMLGITIASGVLRFVYLLRPAALSGFHRPELDPVVLLFTTFIAIASGLIFGTAPAWLAGREDPSNALKSGMWRSSAVRTRTRKALVAGEMAIAVVLVIGTGLLLRSVANLYEIPLGFNVNRILSFSVSLRGERYSFENGGVQRRTSYYSTALSRLAATPGVTSVGAVSYIPLDTRADMGLPVNAGTTPQAPFMASPRVASESYFNVMGISMIAGRNFSSRDDSSAPKVVIVSRDLADKLWPGENPIGRQLYCAWPCKPSLTVVGVIPPIRRFGPREDAVPEYYMPYTQQIWSPMTFVLHTAGDPGMAISSVRRVAAAIDPTQPIYDIEAMRDRLDDNNALVRFELFALGAFSILALLLVSIGLYGVISYSVTQRSREIGLRIALGAQRSVIQLGIVQEGALVGIIGAGLGLISSLGLQKLIVSVLFGVTSHDSITLLTVCILFIGIAVIGSYLPARRVSSIDPAKMLRSE